MTLKNYRTLVKAAPDEVKQELVLTYVDLDPNSDTKTIRNMMTKSLEDELIEVVIKYDKAGVLEQEIKKGHGQLHSMISNLENLGRFTPINVLAIGHLALFEISISRMTKLPFNNVRKLVRDVSGLGLKAIYKKAGLPESMFAAVQLVCHVLQELEDEYTQKGKDYERLDAFDILHKMESYGSGLYIESIGYFTNILKRQIDS